MINLNKYIYISVHKYYVFMFIVYTYYFIAIPLICEISLNIIIWAYIAVFWKNIKNYNEQRIS